MIIDFHTHLLPKEILQNPLAFADQDAYFGYRMIDTPATKRRQRWVTYQKALDDMTKDGIHRIVIQGWPMVSRESCRRQNDYTLEAMDAFPKHFIGFCIVNPKDGSNAFREVVRCAEAGMKGIGELDPEGQGFKLDDNDFLRLCDLCIDLNLPITLHVGEPVGPYYQGKSSVPLQDYVHLAKTKPLLKIVLSHWGGGLPFYELMPDLKKLLFNVYYDTASSPLHRSPRIFRETLGMIGDQKILFGSNYPSLLKTSSEKESGLATLLNEVKAEVNQPTSLDNILFHNAGRLLGLTTGGDEPCQV